MLASSALKKLPLADEQLRDTPHTTPIKPLELPDTTPIVSPVELKPPTALTYQGFSSPGHGWECVEQPQLGEHIRKGTYRYDPNKVRYGELETVKTLAILNRWRTHPAPNPPPRPLMPDELALNARLAARALHPAT